MFANIIEKNIGMENDARTIGDQPKPRDFPHKGLVVSLDRVYGIGFVKVPGIGLFGLSDKIIEPIIWNRLSVGEKIDFSVNNFGSVSNIAPF